MGINNLKITEEESFDISYQENDIFSKHTSPKMDEPTEIFNKNDNDYKVTDNDDIQGTVYFFHQKNSEKQAGLSTKKKLKNDIDGTVLLIKEMFITCEFYTKNDIVKVDLPKSIFPNNGINFGTPINLRLDEISGITKQIISIRNIPDKDKLKGIEEIDALINEL